MLAVEFVDLRGAAMREEVKEVTLGQIKLGILALAQTPSRFDDLVENRL